MKTSIKALFLFVFLLLCLLNISTYADDFTAPPGAEWTQMFPEASAKSVVATSSGYVVAGRQNGPDSSPLLDYWTILVSYNTGGTQGTYKTFDTDDDHNEAYEIIASYDGATLDGYIIAGAKHDGSGAYYNPYMWLMKVGTDLERDWENTFGDPDSDYGYSVINDGSGFILTGEYMNPNESAYLVRTDESGAMTWEACWSTTPRWEFMPVTYDSAPGIGGGLVVATDEGLYKLSSYTATGRPSDTPVWSASTSDVLNSVIAVSDGYVATGHVDVSGDNAHTDLVLLKVNADGSLAWRHTFGRLAPAMGADNMNDYGDEVIQTADGGFAVIGTTGSYAWHGGSDIWLIKTDAGGNMQWDIVAGDENNDFGKGVAQDSANDLVAAGTVNYDDGSGGGITNWIFTAKFSNSYTPPNPSFTCTPSSPFFVQETIEFDAAGSTPGSPGEEILLYEWDFGDGTYGAENVAEHTYNSPGTYTVTLYVTDSNGIRRETSQTVTAIGLQTQWERAINISNYNYGDIVKGSGNSFLIPGYITQSYSNLNGMATKFDSAGNVLWRRLHADNLYAQRDALSYGTLGNDGNYVLVGFRETESVNKRDIRIIKLNASTGDEMWEEIFDYGVGNDDAFDIKKSPSGGYIVTGYATTKLPETGVSGEGSAWLIKIDEDGDEEWNRLFSVPGESFLRGICLTPTADGGYFLVSNRYGSISDVPMVVIKTDGDGIEQWRYTIPDADDGKNTGGIWVHQNTANDYVIAGRYNNEYSLFTVASSGDSHTSITWGSGHNYDEIYDADIMPDNGYILTGRQFISDDGDYGDVYYVRTDSSGNVLWEETMGGPGTGSEYGKSVATFSDGSIVILYNDEDSDPAEDYGSHLFKIGANLLPTGDFIFDPVSPYNGESVTFTASVDDSDGTITHMTWQFGDSEDDPTVTTVSSIAHTYSSTGTYTVTLIAYDNSGGVLDVSHDITVTEAPTDECPDDPDKLEPGVCGCGVPDTDTDGDDEEDCIDNCPAVANADQLNTDGDEYGNACDDDDDNDGMPDSWEETYPGLDPLVDDADGDLDHDGVTNYEEYLAGTDPASRRVSMPFIPLLLDE